MSKKIKERDLKIFTIEKPGCHSFLKETALIKIIQLLRSLKL